jgi:hypothetical protein
MGPKGAEDRGLDFFEVPPLPADPPPDRPTMHPQRPDNAAGGAVSLELVLARTPDAAVRLQHLVAFPTGFEFEVVAQFRSRGETWDPMHGLAGLRGRPGDAYGVLSDEHLRFGIQFSDGRSATNTGPPMWLVDAEAEGPMLHPGEGGASASRAWTTYWCWPLPPPGPLTFVCAWPKFGIELTRRDIDARLLLTAASRTVELWPRADSEGSL